ncbi:MAG TPA: oligosaccharide flippase family protein [Candidatus Saccharimonadales bacterium]|nr:oligosaccharide flippase family protein [Candidatus Saccharimonadales bacterium]
MNLAMMENPKASEVNANSGAVFQEPRPATEFGAARDMNDRYFSTDHLLADLEHHTISSGYVTVSSQAAKFCLNLVPVIILARLLLPQDFGLLAMVTSVMSFLQVFRDAGLSTATIQQEKVTHSQISNLFWINLGVGALLGLIVAAISPVIAWFFHEPRLVGITLVLSSSFLLSGSRVQHQALLDRQMRFKAIASIEIGSVVAGLIAGVAMALLGFGYWSLVGLNMASEVVGCLVTWSVSAWRPQLPKYNSGTMSLLHFGVRITAGSAFNTMARGMDSILIGWRYGSGPVGLYSRAMALLTRPLQQLLVPVGTVFIPALSRLQGDPKRYRVSFMRIYEAMSLAGCVLGAMFLALSHPLTIVLLGPKWEGSAIIFCCLALSAPVIILTTAAGWLFVSQGRGQDFVLMNFIAAAVTIAAFALGLPFGPVGVALSFFISGVLLRLPVIYWLAGRHGAVSSTDLWTGFLKFLPVFGIISLTIWLVRLPIPDSRALEELLMATPSAVLVGGVFMAIYPPSRKILLSIVCMLDNSLQQSGIFWIPFLSRLSGAGRGLTDRSAVRLIEKLGRKPAVLFPVSGTDQAGEISLDRSIGRRAVENYSLTNVRISALIPAYNREKTIGRAIESVLAQEFPATEIVVVDDGSQDRTADVVASFGDKVRLVHQPNAGVSAARNRCVQEAGCDWLAFLDSDDYWLSGHLHRMSEAILATNGKAAIYFSDLRCTPEKHIPNYWEMCGFEASPPFEFRLDASDWAFMQIQPTMFQASVIRRDKYLECGGLPDKLQTREDTLLFFKFGLLYPACSVAGCGTVMTSDGGESLTQKIDSESAAHARASIHIFKNLLWFGEIMNNRQRKLIAEALSDAHFALARACMREKLFGRCLQSVLHSGIVSPTDCASSLAASFKSQWFKVLGDKRLRDSRACIPSARSEFLK